MLTWIMFLKFLDDLLEKYASQVSTDNLVVLQRTLEQASFQQAFSMIVEVVDYISRIQKLGPSPLPVRRLFPIGDAVHLAVKLDDDSLDAVRAGDFFWLTAEKNGVAHRVAMLRVAQLNVNEKSAFPELENQLDAQICGSLCIMKHHNEPSLTQKAMQALTEAVAKVVEDHRRRRIPLAVWRNGKAVSIPATEVRALRETATPYRTNKKKG